MILNITLLISSEMVSGSNIIARHIIHRPYGQPESWANTTLPHELVSYHEVPEIDFPRKWSVSPKLGGWKAQVWSRPLGIPYGWIDRPTVVSSKLSGPAINPQQFHSWIFHISISDYKSCLRICLLMTLDAHHNYYVADPCCGNWIRVIVRNSSWTFLILH